MNIGRQFVDLCSFNLNNKLPQISTLKNLQSKQEGIQYTNRKIFITVCIAEHRDGIVGLGSGMLHISFRDNV